MQRDKLGIDYLNKRNDLLNAVTISDVKRVAARLLDPAKLTTILVGQPAGITPDGTPVPAVTALLSAKEKGGMAMTAIPPFFDFGTGLRPLGTEIGHLVA